MQSICVQSSSRRSDNSRVLLTHGFHITVVCEFSFITRVVRCNTGSASPIASPVSRYTRSVFEGDHDLSLLHLPSIGVSLIEILNSLETWQSPLVDISDSMARMKGLLKSQRRSPCIRHNKFEAQLSTERCMVD